MTSNQIVTSLNQKITQRLTEKKVLKASELKDLNTVELIWLAVYSTNKNAIWSFKKTESNGKAVSKDHHGNQWISEDFILELR